MLLKKIVSFLLYSLAFSDDSEIPSHTGLNPLKLCIGGDYLRSLVLFSLSNLYSMLIIIFNTLERQFRVRGH
jgi:hypothetical protein